jgi:iturin family lipopeptide synthetase C
MKETNKTKQFNIAASQFIRERDYWTEQLSGEPGKNYFPYDFPKFDKLETHPDTVAFQFNQEFFERMLKIAGNSDPKLHMILVAGLVALLAIYTGNEDIIVGTPIDKQDTEYSLLNTILPLRIRLTHDMTFKELLVEGRKTINEAIENQNYPIETLLSQIGLTLSENEFSLFDVAVLLENIQDKKYIEHINYSITFLFTRKDEGIEGKVEYNNARYKRETIERIIHQLISLLGVTIFNLEQKIKDIELLSQEEKMLLIDLNNAKTDYPADKTIHELFEGQVFDTPDSVAIVEVDSNRSLTYKELNDRANQLAKLLKKKGVVPEQSVGIMLDRSVELIIAILGVLKAGGVYLPIDIRYPEERKRFILEDSNTKLLLIPKSWTGNLSWKGEVLSIDKAFNESQKQGEYFPCRENKNLAYIIYTSGSTGYPKGVMIQHNSLVNYISWAAKQYVRNERINFPLYTSISFDLTVTSIFTPLISGNAIVVYGSEDWGELTGKVIDHNHVGIIKLTPSHLYSIRDKKMDTGNTTVKLFIVGGEQLGAPLTRDIYNNFNGAIEIYNEYGPTEATVGCMIYKYNPETDSNQSVPIGVPAANNQIYVLGRTHKPIPVGAVGEIYISGQGVARGYLNNPELTAEKFRRAVISPSTSNKSNNFSSYNRFYRTGDLARWLPDGNIEFIGRIDDQVKIRGFRIQLGEIENHLLNNDDIKEAIVIEKQTTAQRDSNREESPGYLCAYFVSDKKLKTAELRDYLSEKLPTYMLPSYFVQLETVPLTVHGKIDKKSLPDPTEGIDTGVQYHPPTNENQQILVEVWKNVLGVDKIGIDDNYFALGGDSINAIQIAARLQKFKLTLESNYLFEYPTIRELSKYLKSMEQIVEQGLIEGEARLTPIQKWFFEKKFSEMHHFNQAVMLHRLEGFNEEILKKVFNKLTQHHDVLRMSFEIHGNEIRQVNRGLEGPLIEMAVFDLLERKCAYQEIIEEKCNQIHNSMNLRKGPLVKLGLFKTIKRDYLLITIHHLVIDGISWRILFEDFFSFYKQLEEGISPENMEIPLKSTSYKEWAEKLYEYSNSQELLAELEYWQRVEEMALLPMFKSKVTHKGKLKDCRNSSFELTGEDTEKLLKEVNKAYNTEINDILLTAFSIAAADWTGAEKVSIHLEGHGREDIIKGIDITRTIGWFTSLYPVLLDMKNRHDLSAVIKNTKETLRRIPRKGIGYGILRYLTKKEHKQGMEFHSNPGIGFNYLGQFDEDTNNELFQAADFSPGNSISLNSEQSYTLYIIGMISGGKLRMSVRYVTGEYREEEIQEFVNGFKKNLQEIIEHCVGKEETELTISDFTTPIEEEEGEAVFDILSEITLD